MKFAFTDVITEGLYGDLKNNGIMIFATDGQKYLGNITNGSASAETDGIFLILSDSTFKGTVNSEYGLISVGVAGEYYYEDVDVTFINTVHTGSAFLIGAGSSATFENTVSVGERQYS